MTIRYLLDTDTVSALMKPRPNLVLGRHLASEPVESIFTSAITAGELIFGAARSRPELVARVEAILATLPVVSFDEPAAHVYGHLRAQLEAEGTHIGDGDLRIAATARVHDMVVISGNRRHFGKVPGLALEDWLG